MAKIETEKFATDKKVSLGVKVVVGISVFFFFVLLILLKHYRIDWVTSLFK